MIAWRNSSVSIISNFLEFFLDQKTSWKSLKLFFLGLNLIQFSNTVFLPCLNNMQNIFATAYYRD
jgi:hypothetical protein